MQYTHHLRPCITFIIRKPRKKKNEKQAWEKNKKSLVLREWIMPALGKFWREEERWAERKWSSVRRAAWVGPFQIAEQWGALYSWGLMAIIWTALLRIWQVPSEHESHPELFSSLDRCVYFWPHDLITVAFSYATHYGQSNPFPPTVFLPLVFLPQNYLGYSCPSPLLCDL